MNPIQDLRRAAHRRRLEREAAKLDPAPFVVGHGRSGTTLLRLMLDAHPELAIPPETQFIPQLIDASKLPGDPAANVADSLTGHRRFADFGFTEEEIREAFAAIQPFSLTEALRYFFRIYAERQGKPRWGDKSPGYGWTMKRIDRVLPEAHFIHLIRDGRDVSLSLMAKKDNPPRPARQARHWKSRVAKTREHGAAVRHYMEVRYEDLIMDAEPELRRICEFARLDFDPVMLRYYERAEERMSEIKRDMEPGYDLRSTTARGHVSGERRVAIHELTKEPPRADRIGVWKREMPEDHVAEFERVAGWLLDDLGYEVSNTGSAAS
jgi:Sulfotransferase family